MPIFNTNSDLSAYLTQLILPPHLRGDGGQITQKILNGYNTPGISVAVLPPTSSVEEYARTPLLTATFGLRDCADSESSVDAETVFQAASISKPFTALAVLQLVSQGKLNLDVDIENYLALDKNRAVVRDDLHMSAIVNPATVPRTPITLRLLLAHQSGLSTVWGLDGYYGKWTTIPSTPSIINGVDSANNLLIRAFTLPGLGTAYSGGGTTVVQYILTLVTGKPFPTLMRELVLDPLEMTRSTYEQPAPDGQDSRVNYAKAHHNAYTGLIGGTECMIYPEMAAAGLWTTPSDMLKGLRAVFDCLSGSADSFLPPALVAESFTETNGFGGFGIGWRSKTLNTDETAEKRRVILGHNGWSLGFHSSLFLVGDIPLVGRDSPVIDPKPPIGLAWMTNSEHGPHLGTRIMTALGWLSDEPLKYGSEEDTQVFFPVLARTPAEHDKVNKQINGWQSWVGRWQVKDRPRVNLRITETNGLPSMTISAVADINTSLVLLPAAFYYPEAIVWVVRDMNVAVAMKEVKADDKPPVLSLEIWQNETTFRAEKV
ncbi:beta-lactamase/transpeptidase-like protein [Mycena crocata]|nr:beta-lactamase/transpeptidase-like protein [Mycena crocata]